MKLFHTVGSFVAAFAVGLTLDHLGDNAIWFNFMMGVLIVGLVLLVVESAHKNTKKKI